MKRCKVCNAKICNSAKGKIEGDKKIYYCRRHQAPVNAIMTKLVKPKQ